MENPLCRKLTTVVDLTDDDRKAVRHLCENVKELRPKEEIIGRGARPDHVHVVLEGWAARERVLADGSRQIVGILIPGDFCDVHIQVLGSMDHGVTALSPCKVAYVPAEDFESLIRERPSVTRGIWWTTLVDDAVLREWLTSAGRRNAYQAMAHLLCELHLRMEQVGLVEERKLNLPLTQEELGDALGLTAVHTNRVLQRLREEGLLTLKERTLTIHNWDGLREAAEFDPEYLHIRRRS